MRPLGLVLFLLSPSKGHRTMQTPIVRKRWAMAEGYIPGWSHGPASVMARHETVCMLNTTDRDAHEELTGFYANRGPVGAYHSIGPACRTQQGRLNDFADPEPIPPAVDSSSVIESEVPIVVVYLRLDARLAENALVSPIAYAGDDDSRRAAPS